MQKNLFLRSEDFVRDEKCYNAWENTEFCPITKQSSKTLLL